MTEKELVSDYNHNNFRLQEKNIVTKGNARFLFYVTISKSFKKIKAREKHIHFDIFNSLNIQKAILMTTK